MSEASAQLEYMAASAGFTELMRCMSLIAESVHAAPLTRDQLMKRWQLTEEKTLQRWCDELNLQPFEGRGKHARYRMSAVLRAEQKGEKNNGGAGE